MLALQSEWTVSGVKTFVAWLETRPLSDPHELQRMETEVDIMRQDLEEKLIQSFSTPFDRQDIFSISRQMDYILNFSNETVKEMYAFGVQPDPINSGHGKITFSAARNASPGESGI